MSSKTGKSGKSGKSVKSVAGSDLARASKKAGERWRITDSGKSVTVRTTKSSAKIMDDAVRIYSSALKRLAKR
jgi:hypothetical protein